MSARASEDNEYRATSELKESEQLLDSNGDLSTERIRTARSHRLMLVCLWIWSVVSIGVIVYLVAQLNAKGFLSGERELAGDVNGVWSRMSQRVVTFQPDNRYVGNLTSHTFIEDTKKYWLDLVPKGLGFIEVPEYERYPDIPTPYIKYDKPVYTTSVTHQLHCLYMIMHGFNDLAKNHGSFAMDMGENDEGLTREGEDPADHLSHCFDYLRQAIMCHGDTALEGLQTTFGPDVGGSDGWNVKHVCKPWEQIYTWLETHRIDDREWI